MRSRRCAIRQWPERAQGFGPVLAVATVAVAFSLAATAGRSQTAPQAAPPRAHAEVDGLALTPPMGWYPWNVFGEEPQNEKLIEEITDALVSSGLKDAGYFMVRYYGLYANAHRGKVKKESLSPSAPRMAEEDLKRIPSKGWAAMIRKVYEIDPMLCPKCGGRMKVVAFLTEYAVVDRIIDHLKLTFVADKPPPSHVYTEVALMEAEENGEYC